MKAVQEAVLCLYKGEDLVAIVKKNGETLHYKVRKMSFMDVMELYETPKIPAPLPTGNGLVVRSPIGNIPEVGDKN